MINDEPVIRDLPERQLACLSYTGNYIGDTGLFERLFTQLGAWAASRDLVSSEKVFLTSYPHDPRTTPRDELQLDVCMSVPDGVDGADDDVHKKNLPGGAYAVMHAELTRAEEFETAWNAIVAWAEKNNYPFDGSRPSYGIYLNNPEDHPQQHHILDICLSVIVYV
jgi:AraC family transcriptional regulator